MKTKLKKIGHTDKAESGSQNQEVLESDHTQKQQSNTGEHVTKPEHLNSSTVTVDLSEINISGEPTTKSVTSSLKSDVSIHVTPDIDSLVQNMNETMSSTNTYAPIEVDIGTRGRGAEKGWGKRRIASGRGLRTRAGSRTVHAKPTPKEVEPAVRDKQGVAPVATESLEQEAHLPNKNKQGIAILKKHDDLRNVKEQLNTVKAKKPVKKLTQEEIYKELNKPNLSTISEESDDFHDLSVADIAQITPPSESPEPLQVTRDRNLTSEPKSSDVTRTPTSAELADIAQKAIEDHSESVQEILTSPKARVILQRLHTDTRYQDLLKAKHWSKFATLPTETSEHFLEQLSVYEYKLQRNNTVAFESSPELNQQNFDDNIAFAWNALLAQKDIDHLEVEIGDNGWHMTYDRHYRLAESIDAIFSDPMQELMEGRPDLFETASMTVVLKEVPLDYRPVMEEIWNELQLQTFAEVLDLYYETNEKIYQQIGQWQGRPVLDSSEEAPLHLSMERQETEEDKFEIKVKKGFNVRPMCLSSSTDVSSIPPPPRFASTPISSIGKRK